jgi:multicomponent Na+:H+ antiporter subunit C
MTAEALAPAVVYLAAGVAVFALALHAVAVRRHLLRRILALNVMGSGVFLVFGSFAYRNRGLVPDPVPHAMVITGIVVAVCATALLVALARRLHRETGRSDLPDEDGPS